MYTLCVSQDFIPAYPKSLYMTSDNLPIGIATGGVPATSTSCIGLANHTSVIGDMEIKPHLSTALRNDLELFSPYQIVAAAGLAPELPLMYYSSQLTLQIFTSAAHWHTYQH